MANTYTQLHLQLVFAVQYRAALIRKEWKHDLYRYMTGIIQNNKHKLLAINGVEDHIHILIGYRHTQLLSELLKDIKQMSSRWINDNMLTTRPFAWQDGYGAFSYSKSDISNVATYIEKQEEHHKKQNFREEYQQLLTQFEVEYDARYIFTDPI